MRFTRDSRIGETVGRAEYGLKTGKNDWQLSLERAFNSLDQRGALFDRCRPTASSSRSTSPSGSGKVVETRYEAIGTLEPAAVAQRSTCSSRRRRDLEARARRRRHCRRANSSGPRAASRSAGARPRGGTQASSCAAASARSASTTSSPSPICQQDRENAGNPDLVPPQSWEVEGEVGRELGAWGKTRLKLYAHRIDDIIDIIPIGEDGEAIGNLPRATRFGVESTSTLPVRPDRLARGQDRPHVRLREDQRARPADRREARRSAAPRIAGSAPNRCATTSPAARCAWGVEASHDHYRQDLFPVSEIGRGWEGPVFADLFVEHKDVFGLTVRATVGQYAQRPPPLRPHRLRRPPRARSGAVRPEEQPADRADLQRCRCKGNF